MAVLSVASGVLAFLVSWIPYVSILGYLFSLAALVLGVIAIVQTLPKGKYRGIGLAITGCALSFSPVIVAIALQALYLGPLADTTEATAEDPAGVAQSTPDDAAEDSDAATEDDLAPTPQGTQAPQPTPNPQAPTADGSASSPGIGTPSTPSPADSDDDLVDSPELVSVGTGEIASGRMLATITNAAKAGPDDEGRPTVLVTIVLTNKDPRQPVTFFDAEMQVYQNGRTLEMSFYEKDAPRGYDPKLYVTDINPGDSKIFHVPFALEDDRSPITVEIGSSFSEGKVAKDFSLR